ncbi:MAG TPA: protoporphyrinogen oxidase [Candidatus Binataceae bacterium]|nr:protoporphyrinogen oxidase [Candidatus Binataceae bacterium]
MDHVERPRRVAVIGGGISGLAAAHRMRELAGAHEIPLLVDLYERGARVGGALETIRRDGFVIETGADSFLSEKPAAIKLAERLGLVGEQIATQEQFRKTLVVRDGRLVAIPEGFSLIAPTWLGPLFKSPLFSARGKLRIAIEPLIPRRRDDDDDESLASFVIRRLGRETLERIAQPLAGGIYTADPATLSIGASLPRFVEMERRYGSVIRGLRAAARARTAELRGTSGARWSLFVSFRGGIETLVRTIAARIEESIHYHARMGAELAALTPTGETPAWRLDFRDGSVATADAVIGAAPAFAIAPLIQPLNRELAATLADLAYASAATVNLAYRAADFPRAPDAFGFVVPIAEGRRIIAGSFSSLKFAGRAPAAMVLARVFVGGALQTSLMEMDDAAMIAAARAEFSTLLGVIAEPAFAYVRRWPRSMPQYTVGHLARVAEIERMSAAIAGFALAGAYLRGVGIPDCIASGEHAAEAIFAQLAPATG